VTGGGANGGCLLEGRGLHFRWSLQGPDVLTDIDLSVSGGELVGIVGPNAAGKSTLLRICAGLLRARAGDVSCLGRPIGDWDRRELARHLGVVPQETAIPFPYTVEEMVLMGRAPHLGRMGLESSADRAIVEAVLGETDLADVAGRTVDQLSGGERQRVLMARALAQGPEILLCDEPTAHLDLRHQARFFDVLRTRREGGLGVVVVLHDLNLAAATCDRLILLDAGRVAATGTPEAVLLPEILEPVYRVSVTVGTHARTGRRYVLPANSVDPARPGTPS
jgi:iron complex transport system ATP-binding protein